MQPSHPAAHPQEWVPGFEGISYTSALFEDSIPQTAAQIETLRGSVRLPSVVCMHACTFAPELQEADFQRPTRTIPDWMMFPVVRLLYYIEVLWLAGVESFCLQPIPAPIPGKVESSHLQRFKVRVCEIGSAPYSQSRPFMPRSTEERPGHGLQAEEGFAGDQRL